MPDTSVNTERRPLGLAGRILRGLLTVFLFALMIGGGVCGVCIGVWDINAPKGSAAEGVALIFFTVLGVIVIGFVLRWMWRRKKPEHEAGPEQ